MEKTFMVIAHGESLKVYDATNQTERKKFLDYMVSARGPFSDADKKVAGKIYEGDLSMFVPNEATGLKMCRFFGYSGINAYLAVTGTAVAK